LRPEKINRILVNSQHDAFFLFLWVDVCLVVAYVGYIETRKQGKPDHERS